MNKKLILNISYGASMVVGIAILGAGIGVYEASLKTPQYANYLTIQKISEYNSKITSPEDEASSYFLTTNSYNNWQSSLTADDKNQFKNMIKSFSSQYPTYEIFYENYKNTRTDDEVQNMWNIDMSIMSLNVDYSADDSGVATGNTVMDVLVPIGAIIFVVFLILLIVNIIKGKKQKTNVVNK